MKLRLPYLINVALNRCDSGLINQCCPQWRPSRQHIQRLLLGSIVFAQLRYLVQNINKKNQKASVSEIAHLLWLYGESAFIYLLCCLLEEIDFRDPKLQKDQLKAQLLAQGCNAFLRRHVAQHQQDRIAGQQAD